MTPLLKQISAHAATDLADLIQAHSKEIAEDMNRCQEEAVLQEKNPKFNLSLVISVDPMEQTFENKLSWSVRKSVSVSHQIEDPAQIKIPNLN